MCRGNLRWRVKNTDKVFCLKPPLVDSLRFVFATCGYAQVASLQQQFRSGFETARIFCTFPASAHWHPAVKTHRVWGCSNGYPGNVALFQYRSKLSAPARDC